VIAPVQPPRETTVVKALSPERDALEIRFPRVVGYRVDLPEEQLHAKFNEDSILELTPDLVGPTIVRNSGFIGEGVDLKVEHLGEVRQATLLFSLTKRLVETKWRDPGEAPKLHLFGQLKQITKQWVEGYLRCKGSTYSAQLMYQELADMACNKITAGITAAFKDTRPIRAMLDPFNPIGSTCHVRFNTTKTTLWETSSRHCHVNQVVLDSDWEAEFCRAAEAHPRVKSYVKNRSMGFEVPYRYGSEMRTYIPDFIVLIDDGHGENDLLHLIVEIKGYRGEDAKEKKLTMDSYWIPGVNHLGSYGRWAFAEFRDLYEMQTDFERAVEQAFNTMIDQTLNPPSK
jgi:type III restriction enzyme